MQVMAVELELVGRDLPPGSGGFHGRDARAGLSPRGAACSFRGLKTWFVGRVLCPVGPTAYAEGQGARSVLRALSSRGGLLAPRMRRATRGAGGSPPGADGRFLVSVL